MNEPTFELFTLYLNERFKKGLPTTEDCIRYSFFAALLISEGLSPSDIVLEFPHNVTTKEKVDIYIPQFNKSEAVLEFKYHRKIPSGKNLPRPQMAGQLFHDIYRLIQFKSSRKCIRLLVYLTDKEMAAYMSNPTNKLSDFFALSQGNSLVIGNTFFSDKSITFQKASGGGFQARIINVWKKPLRNRHELRIYKII